MQSKLLIIDDDKLITAIYSDFFSGKGYAVETSNSPFGVTSLVRHHCPDVIIVDMNLPGLSGRNLCGLLSADGHQRVLLISGEKQEAEMKNMITDGLAQDYFVKGQPLFILDSKVSRLI
jgi:DNA-binding response OmpR family regulator